MKKLLSCLKDSDAVEKIVGGIFGMIALIAIVCEMAMAGFDKMAVIGGIKDIAGTLITIVMLFVAIRALNPKQKKQAGFTNTFISEMDVLIEKYDPVLSFYGEEMKNGENTLRYNIANKLDAVATNDPGGNHKLFRISEGAEKIEFSVSETIFGTRKTAVAGTIAARIARREGAFVKDIKITREGFSVVLAEPALTEEDAIAAAELVDGIVLLYIAEYNQKEKTPV